MDEDEMYLGEATLAKLRAGELEFSNEKPEPEQTAVPYESEVELSAVEEAEFAAVEDEEPPVVEEEESPVMEETDTVVESSEDQEDQPIAASDTE